MTNKHTHHLSQRVFHKQADTLTVHQLSTDGLVLTDKRTTSGGDAGLPHLHPLDAERVVISRVLVRQPADQAPRRADAAPTHTSFSHKGRERLLHKGKGVLLPPTRAHFLAFSGTSSKKRPYIGNNRHASETPQEGRAPAEPESFRKAFTHDKRPRRGVRQDKDRNSCDRVASIQPAAVNKFTRSQATSRKSARSKKESSANRRAVPVQVWVSPLVKDELSRIASSESLSLSSACAALLERGLQQNVDMQYGALLRPIIEDAIARQMAGIATRLTWLLVRIAFDAGQTRSLVTNILGRQSGMTQPLLKTILENSGRSAKANIMRRTPHIASLISSVEQWMTEDDAHGKKPV